MSLSHRISQVARTWAALAFVVGAALLACDADLETGCRDGECGSGLAPGRVCETERGLPTDVCNVLEQNCHKCHAGAGPGPFPLLFHCDLMAPYAATEKKRWEQMRIVTDPERTAPPRMPLDAFPLAAEKHAVLAAFFEACDANGGECPTGPGPLCRDEGGGGAGAGGAGGAGGGEGGGGG